MISLGSALKPFNCGSGDCDDEVTDIKEVANFCPGPGSFAGLEHDESCDVHYTYGTGINSGQEDKDFSNWTVYFGIDAESRLDHSIVEKIQTPVHIQVADTPEPSTIILLLTGFGGLGFWRKLTRAMVARQG